MVKLQYAKCPGATPIARGWRQGVSLMRVHDTAPPRSVLHACERCGTEFRVFASNIKRGGGRFCSLGCYRSRNVLASLPLGADGTTALIPLRARDGSVRDYATIDASDAEWANQWQWYLTDDGYAGRTSSPEEGCGQTVLLHREILGLIRGDAFDGDHKDRCRLNNRRDNLRVTTRAGNNQNTSSRLGSSSRYRGVSWHVGKQRWISYVRADGKLHHFGAHESEVEAAEAARQGRLRLLPLSVEFASSRQDDDAPRQQPARAARPVAAAAPARGGDDELDGLPF